MNQSNNDQQIEKDWDMLGPILDEALHALREKDRHAVLLRYLQGKTLAEVGGALGLTEDATRKRVDRALEKLRTILCRKGVVISASTLTASLGSKAVATVPAGLTALVTGAAMAGSATCAAFHLTTLIAMTKLKIAAGLIVAAMATTIVYQVQSITKLREENRTLHEQTIELDQLRAENERLTKTRATTPDRLNDAQLRELLRLRGQIGVLRKQLAEAGKGQQSAPPAPQPDLWTDWADHPEGHEAGAKMVYGKALALSLILFADKHQGQFPTNLALASSFLRVDAKTQTSLVADQLELLYQGVYDLVTNLSQAIIVREKQPWTDPKGQWARIYAFGDGHSEVHIEPNADFEKWEEEHMPKSKGQQE